MKKVGIFLVIVVILALAVSAYSYISQDKNSLNQSITPNTTQDNNIQDNKSQEEGSNSLKPSAKYNDVIIIYRGPEAPQKRGTYATMSYTVVNNGKNTVYNVGVTSLAFAEYDDFTKKIGTLKPGEKRELTHQLYIPTDKDTEVYEGGVKGDVWGVGTLELSFKDGKGVSHQKTSNVAKMKLLK